MPSPSQPEDQPQREPSRRRQTYEAVVEAADADRGYYVLTVLSVTIAAFGLLANSAAVVIGAMIIAPLMGPILGIALGLSSGNRRLTLGSAKAELVGVLICLVLGYAIGSIPWTLGLGSEVLARTQPTVYDLVVALAAGAAAAYAMVDKTLSASLAGVAIAVALVPPLAACGICLGAGRPQLALGAFTLFVTNLVAIQAAASTVFWVTGVAVVSYWRPDDQGSRLRRLAPSLLLLLLLGVYLTRTLIGVVEARRQREVAEKTLETMTQRAAGAKLQDLSIQHSTRPLRVIAEVLTPEPLDAARVGDAERALATALEQPVQLVIRSVASVDYDSRGPVYTLPAKLADEPAPTSEEMALDQARAVLAAALNKMAGTELSNLYYSSQDPPVLSADVRTPKALGPGQVAALQADLPLVGDRQCQLVVRSILSRVATAERFVEPTEPAAQQVASPADQTLLARLRDVLARRAGELAPGGELVAVTAERRHERFVVAADLRAAEAVPPATVAAVQADLRRFVQPDLDLTVRTDVAPLASASGWVTPQPGG